jgi:hypothetical protein
MAMLDQPYHCARQAHGKRDVSAGRRTSAMQVSSGLAPCTYLEWIADVRRAEPPSLWNGYRFVPPRSSLLRTAVCALRSLFGLRSACVCRLRAATDAAYGVARDGRQTRDGHACQHTPV